MEDVPVMFTVAQVCRMMQLSRSKVYAMLKSGDIPSVQIGRSRRVPADRFAEYVRRL